MAQKTLCQTGESSASPEVIVSITSAPESADVTKKVMTSSVANPDAIIDRGNCSSISKSATGMSTVAVSARVATPPRSIWIAVFPNTVIHRNVKSDGTISTPSTNSRIVRPREIPALNNPTKGTHTHPHPQEK